jgi:hypothetical protein
MKTSVRQQKRVGEERSHQKTKTARLFRLAVVIAGALA